MDKRNVSAAFSAEQGFGLIETLASLALVTIVVMIFGAFITNATILSRGSRQENTALALAQEKMESVKAVSPAQEVDFNKAVENGILAGQTETITLNGTSFRRVWTYTLEDSFSAGGPDGYPPTSSKNVFQVAVTVSWNNVSPSGTATKSIALVTHVSGRR